ncbi:tRNA lysidine(34) synthetase TilS [Deinococcus irradiatisoli]|uniref:Multifunctional fusion protein n=1 Tax=Deinococcus irradiatisoli TaxID=2202254 RepID=A0A2Z3JDB6_9DEIO|nr:tRNA lysidine(34) synthetase TilS [Deinococcus irradiatisoli]AWN22935.1 tRNA lysidine(34) synthetase TilS [Deinococcus irradiatisoli]
MSVFTPLLTPLRPYAGAALVVGVSGGADSVALLRSLLLVGARPVVAHLDHQLRSESADDAGWVRVLCAELGVDCAVERAPVAQVAARRGWSTEEAARRLRYAFLARVAKQRGLNLILTAHTRRDVAETVLWQLLRGEAVLNGIAPERGALRRPWLDVTREQIEAALGVWQQPWREDESNADTRYTRNWLRAEVLPLLRSRFPGLDAGLRRLARHQAEDNAALAEVARRLTPHASRRGQPEAVLRRSVRAGLQAAGLPFHASHLDLLAAALKAGQTRHLTLPGGQEVSVVGGAFPYLRLAEPREPWPRPTFDPPADWVLRHRQDGDRLRLGGGERKLSDVLGDLKVPRAERDRLWLLARGQQVQWLGTRPPLWAPGAREQVGWAAPTGTEAAEEADEHFMHLALQQAQRAAEAGEVPVGAVIVCGGEVVASAHNRSRELGDMTRHAELDALRQAARVVGPYLSNCTLYVTLEPCPMCLGAMLESRLKRVVYGARNPRAGALGGVTDLLAQTWGPQLHVTPGVQAARSARLLRSTFAQFRSAERPAAGAGEEQS